MRHVCLAVCIFILTLVFLATSAWAIEDPAARPNNRFGIHILFPSELETAARLVNSNGGDWGYVTIPIQSTDRNLEKWQKFMDECRRLHIIPIIRIATFPEGNFWTRPTIFDHIDFANFLNSISWPTKNRYIIVYNEPNSNLEWGGQVDPEHYAEELLHTIDGFKRVSSDFFIISAGLDSHAPNRGDLYKNSYRFLQEMNQAVPGIFQKIDGWASHSYPNNNFSANPQLERSGGVTAYRDEVRFLKQNFGMENIAIFITETGWEQGRLSEEAVGSFYQYAFGNIWQESTIVAITPFLLNGAGSKFSGFSLLKADGSPTGIFETIRTLPKTRGDPSLVLQKKESSQKRPTYKKNFEDVEPQPQEIAISEPLLVFFKWLLKVE